MLPQNMALWLNISSEAFEKMAEAWKSLWPSPCSALSNQVIKPFCEVCLPYAQRKAAALFWRQRDAEKNPDKQALLNSPQLVIFTSPAPCPIYSPTTAHSSSNLAQKHATLILPSSLHFLKKFPMSHKSNIQQMSLLFFCESLCQFNFYT